MSDDEYCYLKIEKIFSINEHFLNMLYEKCPPFCEESQFIILKSLLKTISIQIIYIYTIIMDIYTRQSSCICVYTSINTSLLIEIINCYISH